ncbi:hypothetical protein K501DRAFT_243995 [Backusella circina FSU 941]|nr:hypothetical protein K501DRAFT_243995 [Backusella circina FSU 941]
MPNARKKKAAKNEDFKKKKLKVGKKKAVADNFTDTAFKSRSISLPNQSISEDKSQEITTSRNLTLPDLLVQLKHYNSGVKKDALLGMQDLCTQHPALLVSSLGSVVNGILKLFVDDDREVRKAVLNFLKETFVDIDRVELQPFMSLLVIYTCSAMTHIFEDVRLDAVKLMDLWIQITPDIVVSKFWNRITGNYMSLLSVDSQSISTSTSIPSSGNNTTASIKAAVNKSHLHIHKNKLGLFSSLSKFLEAGLSENDKDHFWFLLNYLDDRHAREAFKRKMAQYNQPNTNTITFNSKLNSNSFIPSHTSVSSFATYLSEGAQLATYSHLHLFESSGPKNNNNNNNSVNSASAGQTASSEINNNEFSAEDRMGNIKNLIETFQPILVASWLEAAPSVFVSSSAITMTPALELIYAILKLSLVLWRAMIGSETIATLPAAWLNQYLQTLLKHFTVYFPFGADSFTNRGAKVDDTLQEMNIMLCELTSLFLLARAMQKSDNTAMPEWAEQVVGYVYGILGYQGEQMSSASTHFRAENLVSLLPAVWGFLNCLEGEEGVMMMRAFYGFYHAAQPTSVSKKIALDFIIRAYLIQSTSSYNGRFIILPDSEYAVILKEWIKTLPKLLWQIRTQHEETSRAILNILCDIARRGEKDIFDMDTLKETENFIAPFFFIQIPSKGPVFGPCKDLPADIQQRALDYVYYVDSKSDKIAFAIQRCREQGQIGLY